MPAQGLPHLIALDIFVRALILRKQIAIPIMLLQDVQDFPVGNHGFLKVVIDVEKLGMATGDIRQQRDDIFRLILHETRGAELTGRISRAEYGEVDIHGEALRAGFLDEVHIGDSQIVYELDKVDYGILSAASYDDLRQQEVFWGDFEDVTQIDITLEGETHTLVSEKDEDDERTWRFLTEEIAEGQTQADSTEETLAEESEDDTLDLSDFEDALSALSATEFTTEKPNGKEEIRVKLHLENESFPEIEIILYRYDGSNCLTVIDGQSVSFVPRASVMELVEAVQTIVPN